MARACLRHGQLLRAHATRLGNALPPQPKLVSSIVHQRKLELSPPLCVAIAYGPRVQKPNTGPPESPGVASASYSISSAFPSLSSSSTGHHICRAGLFVPPTAP